MRKPSKRALLIGSVVALAAVGGAGGAIAASGTFDPKAEKQAFLTDVAGRLGVTSQKLEDALKAAAIDRVDAALAAGRITKDQADAMKAAINAGRLPLGFGPGLGFLGPRTNGHVVFGGDLLSAAATYLGLTQAQLRTQLDSGKSLADIAKTQGKSVDGLKQALTSQFQSNLDQAVKDGKLTSAQRDQVLSDFKSHLDDFVNGTLPAKPFREGVHPDFHPGFGFGFGLAPRLRMAPGTFRAPAFRYGSPPSVAVSPTA
jgi:hypothetical protein